MTTSTARLRTHDPLYSALIGLAAVAILLQALWAGIFIRSGKANDAHWVEVHARGADVAIGLAILALVVAVWRLRTRRDLIIGSAVFVVLLIAEAYIGGLIGNHEALEVIHFPLALALMGLAVWLPLQARRRSIS
jgi:hypothetical protein